MVSLVRRHRWLYLQYYWLVIAGLSGHVRLAQSLSFSLVSSNGALKLVENMASIVASPSSRTNRVRIFGDDDPTVALTKVSHSNGKSVNGKTVPTQEVPNLEGLGGKTYANEKLAMDSKKKLPTTWGMVTIAPQPDNPKEQVWTALSRMESNSKPCICLFPVQHLLALTPTETNSLLLLYFWKPIVELLDELAGKKQQLNVVEFAILTGCIAISAAAPLLGGTLTEFIAPSAAACESLLLFEK